MEKKLAFKLRYKAPFCGLCLAWSGDFGEYDKFGKCSIDGRAKYSSQLCDVEEPGIEIDPEGEKPAS